MLSVLPIQDKNIQKELCELCDIEFDTDSFAYRADDGIFLGVCQFKFSDGCGYINGLKYAPGTLDNEAMIIMLRTAMNFMHRCGIKKSAFSESSISSELIPLSSYKKGEDNIYSIDLDKFYISPCHYNG